MDNDTSALTIMLFHPSSKITVREEYYINSENNLFGNIGGMIGVLIGTSILGMVDRTLAFMQRGTKKAVKGAKG